MSRVTGKPYFLYVLWSERARRFYIGISDDPRRRLEQHNRGTHRSWTARYRPWVLVHQERYENYHSARRNELLLKRQKGGEKFFLLTGLDARRFRTGAGPLGS